MISLSKIKNLKLFWWSLVIIIIVISCVIGWFGEAIKFWWTKGIPEGYYRKGNIYLRNAHMTVWGVDLKNNLLTVKGKKPKGWYVKAYTKWSSSGRKCLTRRDWSENSQQIPRRYYSEYYGINSGTEYIITVPQQVNLKINRCNDEIDYISVRFYDNKLTTGGFTINYTSQNNSIAKGKIGYPNSNRVSRCWKKKDSVFKNETLASFCETELNGPDPSYVYHDQIKSYTINM
ncbi:hypothetical protein, partial [Zooshikella harenae]